MGVELGVTKGFDEDGALGVELGMTEGLTQCTSLVSRKSKKKDKSY